MSCTCKDVSTRISIEIIIVNTVAQLVSAPAMRVVPVQTSVEEGGFVSFFPAFHDLNTSKVQETDVLDYVFFEDKGNEELHLLRPQF